MLNSLPARKKNISSHPSHFLLTSSHGRKIKIRKHKEHKDIFPTYCHLGKCGTAAIPVHNIRESAFTTLLHYYFLNEFHASVLKYFFAFSNLYFRENRKLETHLKRVFNKRTLENTSK